MILSLFGLLIDPTDQFKSKVHKQFSHCFVWFITNIVASVTPLAFIAVSVFLLGQLVPFPSPSLFNQLFSYPIFILLIGIWAGVEIAWYFYCSSLKKRFSIPTSFPHLTTEERQHYLKRVLEHCHNPLASLVRWFYTQNPEHIGSECMEEWLSWAFFSKDTQYLTIAEKVELKALLETVISKCPKIARPSKQDIQLNFMRLHFDEMIVQHKPFIAYVVISIMQAAGSAYLKWMGFEHHSLPGNTSLSYWSYRPNNSNSSSKLMMKKPDESPIFLVHGIGIGVTMYINLIKAIVNKNRSRPVYILELPHISLKVVPYVPTMTDSLKAIDEIFRRHNLNSCSWLGHSYGSIVTAWIIKERPEYVDKLCFVDPVCFALWEPDLIYNFLYRLPSGPIHRVCQFFVAQDLLVSYTLFRNFWWLQNILFPEDIQCPATVFLSSHDFIIDATGTYSYLKRQLDQNNRKIKDENKENQFEIVQMNGLSHGSFLNSSKYISQIVSHL